MHVQGAIEAVDRAEQPFLQVGHHQQFGCALPCSGLGQARVTQIAVLPQQIGEHQFGRIAGEVVEHHRVHVALGQLNAGKAAQVFFQPAHQHRFKVFFAHRDTTAEAGGIEDFQQGRKAVAVAVVGCGREEQLVLEASGEVAN